MYQLINETFERYVPQKFSDWVKKTGAPHDEIDDEFDDEVDDDELDDESDSAAGANEETDSDEPAESTTPTETADDSDAESTLEEQNEKLVEENDILNLALRAALDKVENLLSVVESYRDDLNTY